MENEKTFDKIKRIGREGEQKAKEYLSKNGYIIFDDKEINKRLIKNGINLYIHKKLKESCEKNKEEQYEEIKKEIIKNKITKEKFEEFKKGKIFKKIIEKNMEQQVDFQIQNVNEAKKKYKIILIIKNEKEEFEYYAINQIKTFEEFGCVLSEKERNYLSDNIIFGIGDLIGKRISDNKLCCFEVKSSEKDYFMSGFEQFEKNCIARKNDINVFYIFNNYKEEIINLIDIKELWFNWHFSAEPQTYQSINIIKKKEIVEKKRKYYSNIFVQFELIKCLKHRELCMLSHRIDIEKKSVRYLLAFNLNYLNKHLKRFDFHKGLANLYHSVATLENVPVFSYNLKTRKNKEYVEFNKNYEKYVIGYNLFIDFDADWNWKKALKEVLQVKEIFDEYKVPYYILNSSFKGFHIHIPAEYMPKKDINILLTEINEVIYNLKGIYDLQSIDTSIFDLKRVCKLPYSYCYDGSICLPLNDEQLKHFTPEMVKCENVLKTITIKNRGLLFHTHNLSEEQLKKNVKKFLLEFV
jgi:hypothetical protein